MRKCVFTVLQFYYCFSTIPKRRVELEPHVQPFARKNRYTRVPVAPAQPRHTDSRSLPTNMDYAPPTRPAIDQQDAVPSRQLTDMLYVIVADIITIPIPVRSADSGQISDETLGGNEVCDLESIFKVIVFANLVSVYSAIVLSLAIINTALSRLKLQIGNTLT